MHPGTNVFMVVWDYADLMLLGGLPTDERVLPHILSVDVAVLHMVKFGGLVPTVNSLGQLAEVTCTLEEAFFKVIGMAPSARKKSAEAVGRARMMEEIYQAAMIFRNKYEHSVSQVLLRVKSDAVLRPAKIYRDPIAMTVRPSTAEMDPYVGLSESKYQSVIWQMVHRRVPRLVHECCKLMNGSNDVLHSPSTTLHLVKSEKVLAAAHAMKKRENFNERAHPGTRLLDFPLRQAGIPRYRKEVHTQGLEIMPIIDYEVEPGLTTIRAEMASTIREVSLSNPPPYLPLDP